MIVVLGFDGLEYELVVSCKLTALMQKKYWKTNLNDFEIVTSPVIWGSMLTGCKNEEMMAQFCPLASPKLGKIVKLVQRFVPWAARQRAKAIFDKGSYRTIDTPMTKVQGWLKEKNIETIFDKAKNSWNVPIPGYDGNPGHRKRIKLLLKAIEGDQRSVERYDQLVWEDYNLRKKSLFKALEAAHDLVFFYTNFLDAMGHLHQAESLKRLKYYMEINRFVIQVQREINKEDKLYIISDHGMRIEHGYGDHTNYGFFSSNTGEIVNKPQALYKLLIKNL